MRIALSIRVVTFGIWDSHVNREVRYMYTIVFADDEEEVRQAIIQKVAWNDIGYEFVGEAGNGAEALELVEKLRPDVLLTDIQMPFISGIELARQVREIHPSTQIVFLSGHDDFTYAQKAIQYNIISYLLKPISAAELTEELAKIKIKIDEQFRLFTDGVSEPGKEAVMPFFMSLLLDEFQVENDEERDKELNQKLVDMAITDRADNDYLYTVMSVSILNEAEENVTVEENVNSIDSVLKKYFKSESFFINGKITSILMSGKRGFDKYLHIAVEEICEKVRRIMGRDSGIGIGRLEKGLSSIHKAYVESVKAIGYSTKHKKGIFFIEDMEKNKNSAEMISEKALEIINSSYMNPEISLVSVSREIAVSPNYLSTLIKKTTGSTFIDLLTKKRIDVATDMLLHSSFKIREIAEQCGYNDQHYFSYSFKKVTGVSPNAYRRGDSEDSVSNGK